MERTCQWLAPGNIELFNPDHMGGKDKQRQASHKDWFKVALRRAMYDATASRGKRSKSSLGDRGGGQTPPALSQYELERQKRVAANKAAMKLLGL
jgi:hypothetical protein